MGEALAASGSVPTGFRLVGEDRSGPILVRDRQALSDALLDRDYFARLKRFGNQPADFMLMEERLTDGSTIYRPEYVERRRQLGGDSIKDASVNYDPMTGLPSISLEFDKEGRKAFGRITENHQPAAGVYRRLAIILDEKLYSAPQINEAIYGGNASISGNFTVPEARRLVNVLKAGALPGRISIVEERTVAPTLGEDSIQSGLRAVTYGGIAVLLL